ncbi:type IV toxin-antitoxin system AbiEi family antitoxin [Inquilinus sp. CA228]|uniref:type IV toxin-antitoxin system AbiEi family antitoxin n=1 Tax=Inquilinus sp. CA228 TaxID=3455609 RepID=UPI003F8D86A6
MRTHYALIIELKAGSSRCRRRKPAYIDSFIQFAPSARGESHLYGETHLDAFQARAYFQHMLKPIDPVKLEHDAADGLRRLLAEVPETKTFPPKFSGGGRADEAIDFLLRIRSGDRVHVLACEVKTNGQPRHARAAISRLHDYVANANIKASPVFIAPFLSEEVRSLCRKHKVNYFDLLGNCRLVLPGLYIDRRSSEIPAAERRELKSLFRPKSARVLRLMLSEPQRTLKLTEMSERAQVSLGQAHNVKEALLARGWVEAGNDGFRLTDPDSLLDTWRDNYDGPPGHAFTYYTIMHGKELEVALREFFLRDGNRRGAALSSFSAAKWLAPYVRNETRFFHANANGLARLQDELDLDDVAKGANVVVTVVDDDGPLLDAVEPARGIRVTSPVQTYLDLAIAGDRGQEAAEHLRRECLQWRNE